MKKRIKQRRQHANKKQTIDTKKASESKNVNINTMLQKSIAFFILNLYKINKEKKEKHLFQSWTFTSPNQLH